MELYTLLRSFADSWYLLFMTAFFVAIVVWAFRPGSRKTQDEIATSIFRNDDHPASDEEQASSDRPRHSKGTH